MKKLFAFFMVLLLSISCSEEEQRGVCIACCDSNGDEICKGDVTEKECSEFNKNRLDGYEWSFSGGLTICPSHP